MPNLSYFYIEKDLYCGILHNVKKNKQECNK